jgi:hypothetical protein
MHAGPVSYTPYRQLDGENEHEITEIVCRNYPHPQPVAIDDLSSEHKEILESVSLVLAILYREGGTGEDATFVSGTRTDHCLRARAPLHPNRSYKEVGRAYRNAEARRAGTRPSLMTGGFRYHRLRA